MEIVAKAGKVPVNLLEVSVFFYAKLFSWPRVGKLRSEEKAEKSEIREAVLRPSEFGSEGSGWCEPRAATRVTARPQAGLSGRPVSRRPLGTGKARHSQGSGSSGSAPF